MKDGWEYKKLGEVCEIYQPKTLATSEMQSDGAYYVYGANGIIGRYSEYNHEKSELLMTCRGATCGTLNVSFPKSWINGNAMVLHPKENSGISSIYFLKYLLSSLDLSSVITGAAQPQITRKSLSPILLPIPPLSEQHAIVEELDLLNDIIDKKKAELEELNKLAQSVFYDMFGDPVENDKGWEVKKLGELVELKNGLNFTPKDNGNCVRIIGVADFKDLNVVRNVRLIGFKSIEGEVAPDYYLQDGDILIVRSNGSKELVGRNLMIYTNGELVTYSGFCIRCRIQNMGKLSSVYLNAFLSKREIRKILRQEGRGANISNINQKILSSQIVPLPPLPLQQQFASRISALEKMKEKVAESMTETQTLLAATMDKYFG